LGIDLTTRIYDLGSSKGITVGNANPAVAAEAVGLRQKLHSQVSSNT
jgi:hypothetical protein